MNPPTDPRTQLSLVEAKLFASVDLTVISLLDESDDADAAIARLQELGMSEFEAETVVDMPLRSRTIAERRELFKEAERLRAAM